MQPCLGFSSYSLPSQWLLFSNVFLSLFYPLLRNSTLRTSLIVQWLNLQAPNAGGLGSIPGQRTRSHMPQLKPSTAKQFFFLSSILQDLPWATLPLPPHFLSSRFAIQLPSIISYLDAMSSVSSAMFPVLQSVQLLSHVRLFAIPWTAACQASLSITNYRSLLKLLCFESVKPSNHLILCRPLLLLPSIFPSNRVFSNGSALCIRWSKYWSFRSNISPSNEYSWLISFRMDWLDLLAVQGTLKSLLQHHSSKASILQGSAFLIVQLSHDYWKNHSFD